MLFLKIDTWTKEPLPAGRPESLNPFNESLLEGCGKTPTYCHISESGRSEDLKKTGFLLEFIPVKTGAGMTS
jgi:hypothetical protein